MFTRQNVCVACTHPVCQHTTATTYTMPPTPAQHTRCTGSPVHTAGTPLDRPPPLCIYKINVTKLQRNLEQLRNCAIPIPSPGIVLLRCARARPSPTLPACALDRSPLPPLIPNKSSVLFYFVAIAARERQASGAWVAVSSSGLVCSG